MIISDVIARTVTSRCEERRFFFLNRLAVYRILISQPPAPATARVRAGALGRRRAREARRIYERRSAS